MFHTINLDKNSNIPVYQQLADAIRDLILSGTLPNGTVLPSQRKLAEILGISRNTVIAAIDSLTEAKLVSCKQNSKTIVTKPEQPESSLIDWDKQFRVGVIKFDERRRLIQSSFADRCPDIPNISMASLGEEFCITKNTETDIMGLALSGGFKPRHFSKFGHPKLRESIKEYVKKHGITCETDNILIFSSVIQALNASAFLLLNMGTNLIYELPNKTISETLFSTTHSNQIGIELDEHGIDISALSKHIRVRNARLYLNQTNHNPTGKTASKERRIETLKIVNSAHVPVIEVESMRDLWITKEYPLPLKGLPDSGNVIHVGSIARNLVDNYVVAWVIADSAVIEELANIKSLMDAYPSTYHQEIIHELLESGEYERYLTKIRAKLAQRKHDAHEIMKKYMGDIASWNEKDCDIYMWLEFEKSINIKTLFEKSQNVIFYPGYYYHRNDISHMSVCPSSVSLGTFESSIKYLRSLI